MRKKKPESPALKKPAKVDLRGAFTLLGKIFLCGGLALLALLFLSLYEVRFAELGKRAQDLRAVFLRSKFMATVRGNPARPRPAASQKIEVPEAPKRVVKRAPASQPVRVAVKPKNPPPPQAEHSERERRELETLIPEN